MVVSQEQCLVKVEAKLIPQYIPFKYAFPGMVSIVCFSSFFNFWPYNFVFPNGLTDYNYAALNLIFSFTNGGDWDGPYRLQFQVPKALKNKPIEFFNEVKTFCQSFKSTICSFKFLTAIFYFMLLKAKF